MIQARGDYPDTVAPTRVIQPYNQIVDQAKKIIGKWPSFVGTSHTNAKLFLILQVQSHKNLMDVI